MRTETSVNSKKINRVGPILDRQSEKHNKYLSVLTTGLPITLKVLQ